MEMNDIIKWIAIIVMVLWYANWHQHQIQKETKWLEKHGKSEQEITLTLQEENRPW